MLIVIEQSNRENQQADYDYDQDYDYETRHSWQRVYRHTPPDIHAPFFRSSSGLNSMQTVWRQYGDSIAILVGYGLHRVFILFSRDELRRRAYPFCGLTEYHWRLAPTGRHGRNCLRRRDSEHEEGPGSAPRGR
jgi:hypothetical protein